MGLSEAECAALSPFDRDALVRLGGHSYLVVEVASATPFNG